MSRQTDPAVEQRAIMYALAKAQRQRKRLERTEASLWQAFFKLADAAVGEGQPYQFLDEMTGDVIARQVVHKERLDENLLAELLSPEEWEAVTEPRRQLNAWLLEAAMLRGQASREIVQQAVTTKDEVRRYGPRPAGRELLEAAAEGDAEEGR